MGHRLKFALAALALACAVPAVPAAGEGLTGALASPGLKAQPDSSADRGITAFGAESAYGRRPGHPADYSLFGGTREAPRLGLRAVESYGGIAYALAGGWVSSIEASYAQESLLAPRRYALTGQLQTTFGDGRTFSVGLQYRAYGADAAAWPAAPGGAPHANGYTLAPTQAPGTGYAPGYQLQLSYQHSAASAFGMSLGREAESLAPYYDPLGTGPRQFMFTGQHWLTPSWGLSYDVLTPDLSAPLREQAQGLRLGLGLRYRF